MAESADANGAPRGVIPSECQFLKSRRTVWCATQSAELCSLNLKRKFREIFAVYVHYSVKSLTEFPSKHHKRLKRAGIAMVSQDARMNAGYKLTGKRAPNKDA
ncbi:MULTISPECIES: hypothetical protein [Sphingopyxis]|uniref:hypothetical protein n=1 Tax=Sphingopyxis TaxID=165697 RepID=UPI0019333DF6|nr:MULTISPECIES: hypothetical protein [Sphingopyxis]